jgi:hypothetical protein
MEKPMECGSSFLSKLLEPNIIVALNIHNVSYKKRAQN